MTPEQELRILRMEYDCIQAENTRLRKIANERNRHVKRVALAYRDALQLALWQQGGIQASRRYAKLHSMSQRRWQNAIGLLRVARVVVGCRCWSTSNMSAIEPRLCNARQYAIEHPFAYHARLNRHATR